MTERDALRDTLHELAERLDAIEHGHAAEGEEIEARWRAVHDSLQETIRLVDQAE